MPFPSFYPCFVLMSVIMPMTLTVARMLCDAFKRLCEPVKSVIGNSRFDTMTDNRSGIVKQSKREKKKKKKKEYRFHSNAPAEKQQVQIYMTGFVAVNPARSNR